MTEYLDHNGRVVMVLQGIGELWFTCRVKQEGNKKTERRNMAEYIDDMGKRVVVSSGVGDGSYYMICRVNKSGTSLHRVKSKFLPIRKTRKKAEEDLDRYAEKMGWKKAL